MADVAALVYEIDSSQAAGAAKNLLAMRTAAGQAATSADRLAAGADNGARSFKRMTDAAKEEERLIKSLAAEFNPLLAAQLRYSDAQARVATSVSKGVITGQQAEAQLERLANEYRMATSSAQNYANGMRGVNNVQSSVGNQFAQLNDVVVTAWGGMNPALIGMQQGMQMVQGFAGQSLPQALGTLKGAFAQLLNPVTLVTITAIAAGAALIQWAMSAGEGKNAAVDFATALGDLQAATANINSASKLLASDGLTDVYEAYGAINEEVRRNVLLLTEAAIYNEMDRIRASAQSLRAEMTGGWITSDIDDVRIMFGTTNDAARMLLAQIQAISAAKTFDEQAKAAAVLRDNLLSGGRSIESFDGAARAAVIKIIEMADGAERLSVQVDRSKKLGEEFAALDLAGGVVAAGNTALILAQNLNISLETAMRLAALGPQGLGELPPTGGRGDPRDMGGSFIDWNTRDVDAFNKAWEESQKKLRKAGGGGGGIAARELAAAEKGFQSLRELLQKESMFQVAEWEKRQAQLDAALAQKLISEQNYQLMRQQLQMVYFGTEYERNALNYQMDLEQLNAAFEAKLLSEEQYLMRRRQLQWDYLAQADSTNANLLGQELGNWASHFGQMNSLAGGGYDKLLRLQRAFAAASALVNTWKAYTDVLASGEVMSPWAKLAWAGKILAAGMGAVNAIKGGGGGGGGGGSAATATSATRSEPQRNILVRLEGPDFMVDIAESIMTQIYDQSRDGRVVISRDR